jgi:hypothetical protein
MLPAKLTNASDCQQEITATQTVYSPGVQGKSSPARTEVDQIAAPHLQSHPSLSRGLSGLRITGIVTALKLQSYDLAR